MNRFDIFEVAESGSGRPTQELADRMIVRSPRILVADWHSKEFETTLSGLRANFSIASRSQAFSYLLKTKLELLLNEAGRLARVLPPTGPLKRSNEDCGSWSKYRTDP